VRLLHLALVSLSLALTGCGNSTAKPGESPRGGCQNGVLPAGHWIGEWQTYALARPELVRSGTLDVVIAASGKLTGQSAESDNPDLGTLSGTVKATGEFSVDSVVMRGEHQRKYQLSGTLACAGSALDGAGTSSWGPGEGDKGNLKFRLQRAD